MNSFNFTENEFFQILNSVKDHYCRFENLPIYGNPFKNHTLKI